MSIKCPAVIAIRGMVYICDGDICLGVNGTHGSARAGAIWTSDSHQYLKAPEAIDLPA